MSEYLLPWRSDNPDVTDLAQHVWIRFYKYANIKEYRVGVQCSTRANTNWTGEIERCKNLNRKYVTGTFEQITPRQLSYLWTARMSFCLLSTRTNSWLSHCPLSEKEGWMKERNKFKKNNRFIWWLVKKFGVCLRIPYATGDVNNGFETCFINSLLCWVEW